MAKRRLNQDTREKLYRMACESAASPNEAAAVEKTYAKAAKLVRAAVDKEFPVNDMTILQKYGATREDKCIRIADTEGAITGFQFRESDELIPQLPRRSCSSRAHLANAQTIKSVNDYDHAKIALEKKLDGIKQDYHALIFGTRYAEDVLELWPASAPILEPFIQNNSTALAALSEDAIARIRNTNLGATQVAA